MRRALSWPARVKSNMVAHGARPRRPCCPSCGHKLSALQLGHITVHHLCTSLSQTLTRAPTVSVTTVMVPLCSRAAFQQHMSPKLAQSQHLWRPHLEALFGVVVGHQEDASTVDQAVQGQASLFEVLRKVVNGPAGSLLLSMRVFKVLAALLMQQSPAQGRSAAQAVPRQELIPHDSTLSGVSGTQLGALRQSAKATQGVVSDV